MKTVIKREDITGTEEYKGLSHIQQTLTLKRTNFLQIDHGYQVAKNIGLENWLKQSNFSNRNINIIKELLTKNSE